MNHEKIILVYDKECPVCEKYSQVIKIRESVGDLVIINAREKSDVMDEITDLGIDIDQGMVVKMGGQFYYGANAIHVLALLSSRSGVFNKINYYIFKSKTFSKVLYPVLRCFRNLLLKVLAKSKIGNLEESSKNKF